MPKYKTKVKYIGIKNGPQKYVDNINDTQKHKGIMNDQLNYVCSKMSGHMIVMPCLSQ